LKIVLQPWRIYYGVRTIFLATSLIFTIAWVYAGYDSTFEQIFDPDPTHNGIGIHNSTLQSMSLLVYFLVVNFQVGGLKSLSQLWREIKLDLKGIFGFNIKEYEVKGYVFHPYRAIIPALFIPVTALFVFEIPYVFLLNYYHFNSVIWPTYVSWSNPSPVFYRNILTPIACTLVSLLFIKQRGSKYLGSHINYKYRLGKLLSIFAAVTVLMWGVWIIYPSNAEVKTVDSINSNLTKPWVLPTQKLFPQNTYVFFNVSIGDYYIRRDLDGFHVVEDVVHTLNIVTKYMVFLTVGYVFMVQSRKRDAISLDSL